ncbi:MAG: 3-dehydroquinate synthase [Candidatus Kapabacteria bacterium]|nr:3-dehydroquinate synthase [Candidatus Kapabacteria bacterium]
MPFTKTLSYTLPGTERTIPYTCGADIWGLAAEFILERFPKHNVAIITDTNVAERYQNRLETLFSEHPRFSGVFVFPAGEASKSRAIKDDLEDRLFAAKLGRDTLIVAVGGGVVGDLAGYLAATFHRGVPLIHLPTTLLAQVDSCIGGKTGINHSAGKNLIGAFYQPEAIFADITTLETLSDIEFYNGMAEVIKYAASLDPDLWTYLEANEAAIKLRSRAVLSHIIARSAQLKMDIVCADEKEAGIRAILNFGHTAGHAFEALSTYQIAHGFAVASGMRVAMRLSAELLGYPEEAVQRFDTLLERYHLKNDYSHRFSRDAVWHSLTMDKKSREGAPRFVLMRSPTEYVLAQPVERDAFERALNASIVGAVPPQMCVSVMPQYATDIVPMLGRAADADMIELRVDMIPMEELELMDWEFIREHAPKKPLLVTCRSREEGGYFIGSDEERLAMYNDAMLAGVEWLDVEHAIADELLPYLPIGLPTKIVLSHHIITTGATFEELRDKLDDMTDIYADVYKLIFTADSPSDALVAMNLIEYAKSRFLNVVIHAMGELGEPSRILGSVRGNAWTYLALDGEAPTASGQITLSEAKNVYFLHEKSMQISVYGLLGYPTRQSRGKYLHNALYKLLPNSNSLLYLNFPTPEAKQFWSDWRESLSGLSITIPHKEAIFNLLDDISEEARLSGVCNTAIPINGRWKGFNTDVLALEDILRPHGKDLEYGVLIIGTGATTQSTIAALNRLGVKKIYVIGRNRARVGAITSKFRVKAVTESDFGMLDIGGIIQTTSVGMTPHVDEMPYGSELFRRGMIVLDVIYNPIRTKFIQTAQYEGCTTITGDEMFIRQAAHQFRLFTGVDVPIEEVRRVWNEIAS